MEDGIVHHGLSRNRLPREPLEQAFADQWEVIAKDHLGHLLYGQDKRFHEVTQRDATIAATIMQWLGSPVGQGFLDDVKARMPKPRVRR